jgi:hypothetical protein
VPCHLWSTSWSKITSHQRKDGRSMLTFQNIYIWGDLSSITRVEVNRFFSKLDKFLTPRLAEDIADPFHEIVWSNTRFSCTVCRRNHFLKILYLHSCYVVSRMLWL